MSLTSILPGQKSYATGLLMILVGILSFLPGLGGIGEPLADIDGETLIGTGAGIVFLRMGIARR